MSTSDFYSSKEVTPSLHSAINPPNTPSLEVVLETLLLTSTEPMSIKKLQEAANVGYTGQGEGALLGGTRVMNYDTLSIQEALESLAKRWNERGLELLLTAEGYRFRTRLFMQIFIERAQTARAPRYSKSVLETLAVIAYRQPVTRGDIETIRGVAVNTQAIKSLEARGWIESIGIRKDTPGQPALWATTPQFLNDLGLRKLDDLPPMEDIVQLLDEDDHKNEAAQNLPSQLSFDVASEVNPVDSLDRVSEPRDEPASNESINR